MLSDEGQSERSGRRSRQKKWRGGPPPVAPTWEASWNYEHCMRNPRTFEAWAKRLESWEMRIVKWVPRAEAGLLLQDAIKGPDATRIVDRFTNKELYKPDGIDKLREAMKSAFQPKSQMSVQQAMDSYEGVRRDVNMGIKAYVSRFLEVEKAMRDAGLKPYEDEARASKFLKCARLLPGDARNVMTQAKGYDFEKIKDAMELLWPMRPPAHSTSGDAGGGQALRPHGVRHDRRRGTAKGKGQGKGTEVNTAEIDNPWYDDAVPPTIPEESPGDHEGADPANEEWHSNTTGWDSSPWQGGWHENWQDEWQPTSWDVNTAGSSGSQWQEANWGDDEQQQQAVDETVTQLSEVLSVTAKKLQEFTASRGSGWSQNGATKGKSKGGKNKDKDKGKNKTAKGKPVSGAASPVKAENHSVNTAEAVQLYKSSRAHQLLHECSWTSVEPPARSHDHSGAEGDYASHVVFTAEHVSLVSDTRMSICPVCGTPDELLTCLYCECDMCDHCLRLEHDCRPADPGYKISQPPPQVLK
jgi:hypothetical protein